MQKEENKRSIIIALGVWILVIGVFLLSSNYLEEKVDKAYNYMNLQLLEVTVDVDELEDDDKEIKLPSINAANSSLKTDKYEKYYVAKLSIPKINLEKGLVAINSKYNNVSQNIQIIEGSSYPNKKNGNLILASHAGTNSVSYFRNLYKLEKGDTAVVTYKGVNYTYKVVNIYTKPKTGKIAIYRDYNKTTLTLITCTRNTTDKQTVYILELVSAK